METFSALLALCAGNSPVPGEFPAQRPVTRSFDIFFDLPLNKRLRKQSWGWWFETLSDSLWRHCNVILLSWLKKTFTLPLSSAWGDGMCQKRVSRSGTSNYTPQYLCDVITCPCPWYLLLARESSNCSSQFTTCSTSQELCSQFAFF